MSTDPISAREQDRAVEEDQELRAPLTEYPEEPERGAEDGSDAGIERNAGLEREYGGIEREYAPGDENEEAVSGTAARGTMAGTAGTDRFGDTGAGTGYETPSEYGRENGTGYGTTAGGMTDGVQNDGMQNGSMQDGGMQNDIVIAPEQNIDFRTRWREIQAEFIDDPKQAAEHADHLVAEITQVFVAQAEQERNRLASSWQQNGASGTEELRLIMRRYRGLVDHMLDQ